MAVSDVDKKYLGRFASNFKIENPLLAQNLFQVSGIFTMLSGKIVKARKLRKSVAIQNIKSVDIYIRIIWHAREGIKILEQYIFPMVANYGELKVLSYKLRASFYHLYVLFYNSPIIDPIEGPESIFSPPLDEEDRHTDHSSLNQLIFSDIMSSSHTEKHGCNLDTEDAIHQFMDIWSDFMIPPVDYRPIALRYFQEAVSLAENHLSRSHPLRLSLMVEYSAFMYDCLYEREESRRIAELTVTEAYKAREGMDIDSYEDSAALFEALKVMMIWGLDENIDGSKISKA